jgi:hypothetical protein
MCLLIGRSQRITLHLKRNTAKQKRGSAFAHKFHVSMHILFQIHSVALQLQMIRLAF